MRFNKSVENVQFPKFFGVENYFTQERITMISLFESFLRKNIVLFSNEPFKSVKYYLISFFPRSLLA